MNPKRRLPIRWVITFWSALATACTVLVFTGGVLINIYIEQIETADLVMQNEVRHLLNAPAGEAQYGSWLQQMPPDGPLLACFIDPANERFHPLPSTLPEAFAEHARNLARPRNLRLPSGDWRVAAYRIDGKEIILAYDLFDVKDRVADLLAACLLALPLGVLFAAWGAWIVAGRSLAPLRAATEAAVLIGAADLDRRLPDPTVDDEIGRLTRVLNQMLARLEQSFRQSDRFAADASHELRTPLTILRGEIEGLLARTDLSAPLERGLISLQEEVARLDRITEQLLLLARLDAGKAAAVRERVDLSRLAREVCEDGELIATSRHVRLETQIAPGLFVVGDPGQIHRVLINLLDNACKFNAPEGLVRCLLNTQGTEARLSVANTGPGVPLALRPQLFDRFFRADPARGHEGHGLGLSLCREIAIAHGGTLTLSPDADERLTEFVVTLPLVRD